MAAALTADQILAIPDDQPERLFTDRTKIGETYTAVCRAWRASTDPRARDVVSKIITLRTAAYRKHNDDTWTPAA